MLHVGPLEKISRRSINLMNRSMPPAVIIPELPYADVRKAVDWLCETFGFTERLRIGDHRAQLQFGDGSLVVTQAGNSNSSVSVMVRVANVDVHYEHVVKSGTKIIQEPADYPFGERQYTVEDPGGHRWTFSQTIADVDPADWGGTLLLDQNL
jgi:uncharacterized glyoxalase superfamily protein PhnB